MALVSRRAAFAIGRRTPHGFDFPPGYGWRDVPKWGLRSDVVRREGRRIVAYLH